MTAPDVIPSPAQWRMHMVVEHRITGYRGTVVSVDFDEDLVSVDVGGGHELTWRIENVYEPSTVLDHPSHNTPGGGS